MKIQVRIMLYTVLTCCAAFAFSACENNENIPENTNITTASETSLTLTEIIENEDEEFPTEIDGKIRLSEFDPFPDKIKLGKAEEKELREAVHKISDAFSFYNSSYSFCSGSEYFENAADTDTVFEYDGSSGNFYSPLNTDYADSKEKLVQKMIEAFTENHSTEKNINGVLFITNNYKIIDGKLCMRISKANNLYPIDFNNIKICSCEGDSAEIIADEEGSPENDKKYYLKLQRSDEYGWRLDSFQECYPHEADLFYTALYLKKDTINKILYGGNYKDDPEIIFDDDKIYIETDLDMSIEEMHDFFAEAFDKYYSDTYSERYIDNIFIEKDGKIFRDHDAKRHYMPEPKMDIFEQNSLRSFYDSTNDSTNSHAIVINEKDGIPIISSWIPIKEKKAEIPIEKFIPFKDADVSENVKSELREAIIKIADSRAMLYANITGFRIQDDTYLGDMDNVLEKNDKEEYTYAPIDQEYASTFDELTDHMRAAFTENYISDEELQKTLFESDGRNVPEYKMIDGYLCARYQYMGVMTTPDPDEFYIISYDGNSAKIIAIGHDVAEPSYMTMDLINSDEYGWRLDSIESEFFDPDPNNTAFTALSAKRDTLNKILGGGNTDKTKNIEIDGEMYTPTDIDMSISQMTVFFADMFGKDKLIIEEKGIEYRQQKQGALRSEYIQKYITDVYTEKDGVIYRKLSAPEYYLPEVIIDPYNWAKIIGNGWDVFGIPLTFILPDGTEYKSDIYFDSDTNYTNNGHFLDHCYVCSDLPIMEIND